MPDINTVFEVFEATTRKKPRSVFHCIPSMPERAYCSEGAEYSYQYIYESASQLAQSYSQSNYGHGHRVGLLLENRPEFFFHYLALNSLGTSIVPINPDYRHDELVYLIGHCDAQLIITISTRVEDMEKAAAECVRKPPVGPPPKKWSTL